MDGRTALLGAACALLLLSGCGGDDPAPVGPAVPSPAALPAMSAAQRAELLGVLSSVVPGQTATDDEILQRASSVCQDIVDGAPPEKVRSGAKLRFQAGASFSLEDEEADSIVTAVETIWCPAPAGAPSPSAVG